MPGPPETRTPVRSIFPSTIEFVESVVLRFDPPDKGRIDGA